MNNTIKTSSALAAITSLSAHGGAGTEGGAAKGSSDNGVKTAYMLEQTSMPTKGTIMTNIKFHTLILFAFAVTFLIPYKKLQNAQLSIHGILNEHDTFGNDALGRQILKIHLRNITEKITVGGVGSTAVIGQTPINPSFRSSNGEFFTPVTI